MAPIFLPIVVAMYAGASEAGIVVAMFYFAQMLSPFWGWLSDKTNWHRGIYMLSYVLVGLGVGLFPLEPNLTYWLVMSFLLGLGVGAANTVAEIAMGSKDKLATNVFCSRAGRRFVFSLLLGP